MIFPKNWLRILATSSIGWLIFFCGVLTLHYAKKIITNDFVFVISGACAIVYGAINILEAIELLKKSKRK